MTPKQFEDILNSVTNELTDQSRADGICTDSKKFETMVLKSLQNACRGISENADRAFHAHAFPDFVVNGFGVEVKHTIKNSWLAVGNSIFEGMRDDKAQQIYVVYGKMGGWPEVRWARYEDCVTHVRISHSPRFVIEMDNPTSLFKTINIDYQKFAGLSPAKKMLRVRQYSRSRLRPGETLWWLEDLEEQQHTLPISVKVYRTLSTEKKRQLRAEAALLCPEIVQGGRVRSKYDRAGFYLITHHAVIATQIRDLFSAGSVGAPKGQRGHKYIITAIQDIENEMRKAAAELDNKLFNEYWEKSVPPESRISTWLNMADKYATDWIPSKELFKDK